MPLMEKPIKTKQGSSSKRPASPSGDDARYEAAMAATSTPRPRAPVEQAMEGWATRAKKAKYVPNNDDDRAEGNPSAPVGTETATSSSSFAIPPGCRSESSASPPPLKVLEPDSLTSALPALSAESGPSTLPTCVEPDDLKSEPNSPTYAHSVTTSTPQEPHPDVNHDRLEAGKHTEDCDGPLFQHMLYAYTHKEDYGEVSRNIGSLVIGYVPPKHLLPTKSLWKLLDSSIRQKLTEICPRAAEFIDHDATAAKALFQAYFWRVLDERLFSAQDKWATPNWASFGQVSSVRENFDHTSFFAHPYHQGIHHMARILQVHEGPHVDTDRLVGILRGAIRPLFDLIDFEGKEEHTDVGQIIHAGQPDDPLRNLDDILRRLAMYAIKADFAMISSPCHMKMEFLDPETRHACGFPFREVDMRAHRSHRGDDYESLTVDFVIEPMLRTYGPPKDLPMGDEEKAKYFASVAGGYSDCMESTRMSVFVSHLPKPEESSRAS